MGLFPNFLLPSSAPTSLSNVTDAPAFHREHIGSAGEHLQDELVRMYWIGVRRELTHIVLTLRRWQGEGHADYSKTVLPDEEDHLIHGYDTFLDQVSHSSRNFAARNNEALPNEEEGRMKRKAKPKNGNSPPSYAEALQDRAWDLLAEANSSTVKEAVRLDLEDQPRLGIQRRRARMLLQAGQFLDMDKVIEYREPEKLVSFWKRPAVPQLKVVSFDDTHMPILGTDRCSDCQNVLRGSLHKRISEYEKFVCEGCYRKKHYADPAYTKLHKHCCLQAQIKPTDSIKICLCTSVPKIDATGATRALFPVKEDPNTDAHINPAGEAGKLRCGLYELPDMVAEAKFSATRLSVDKSTTLGDIRRADLAAQARQDALDGNQRPRRLQSGSLVDSKLMVSEFGQSYGDTDKSYQDIPFYLRPITDKYPYGNVHMAIRVGPLVIENGVANTLHGALITYRDPPNLQVLRDQTDNIEHSLLVTGSMPRELYKQKRRRTPKRYKAMMKQVVGGAFCSFFDENVEDELVDAVITETMLLKEGMSVARRNEVLEEILERLIVKMKAYLSSRIEVYLASIVARLIDPAVALAWTFQENNCQVFCDNLINRDIFGALLPRTDLERADEATLPAAPPPHPMPLYLMSFVCRPGAYVKEKVRSKFDVPNGLTEEYLLKFRYGRHDESDIMDSLAEYWTDWGAFEDGPIYSYQDLFPWDCTEAYNRYPVKCGNCNISKHVWAFPFDSWSMLTHHLARPRQLYPRPAERELTGTGPSTGIMSDASWFQNRMTVLLAQDVLLTAAVAMARCEAFQESTHWLHKQSDVKRDRLKLGGIQRAQPFSHHFEKGAYHLYFAAEWTHLAQPLKIAAYERIRDGRARQKDVGNPSTDDDRGGGCGGFGCGTVFAACAAACAAGCGGQCGSGCVSSCDSGGDGGGCSGGCGGGCGG